LQQHYPEELVISPWLGSYFFGFNLAREPFTESPDLRLALLLAIDRELLAGKVAQYGEQPSFTLVPPGIIDYVSPSPEWESWTQEQRNEEARRLYAKAGYDEDRPLRFEIRYDSGENNKKMALALASLWKQVLGVRTTMVNEELTVFLQNRKQKVLTQVFRAGWIGEYADAYSFLEVFRTGHRDNDYGYSNEVYDSLLDQITSERIPSRRRRMMYEAERMLLADIPFIPVYTYVTKRLVDPRLKGWESNVMDHHHSKNMFLLKTVEEMDESRPALPGEPGGADPDLPDFNEVTTLPGRPVESVEGESQVGAMPAGEEEHGQAGDEAAAIAEKDGG
jgi:oligopeptide transport system substrate-binding protein